MLWLPHDEPRDSFTLILPGTPQRTADLRPHAFLQVGKLSLNLASSPFSLYVFFDYYCWKSLETLWASTTGFLTFIFVSLCCILGKFLSARFPLFGLSLQQCREFIQSVEVFNLNSTQILFLANYSFHFLLLVLD